jgi:hypothetical protein
MTALCERVSIFWQSATTTRRGLTVGDYAIEADGAIVATISGRSPEKSGWE